MSYGQRSGPDPAKILEIKDLLAKYSIQRTYVASAWLSALESARGSQNIESAVVISLLFRFQRTHASRDRVGLFRSEVKGIVWRGWFSALELV
jgi:hypothetical protein